MTLVTKFNYLFTILRDYGLREFLRIGWLGLWHHGTNRLVLLALTKPTYVQRSSAAERFYDFHFASIEELMAMKNNPDYEIAQLDVERVRNGTARCLLQLDGDQLTGYTWVWLNKLAYIADGFYLNLPDDAIYNYKALTLPVYRGFGFQGLRHVKLLELLAADGIRRLFGFVASENTRSFRGVRKSGYQVVGELLIRKNGRRVQTRLRLNADFWPGKPALDDMGCPVD